jgi:hypothetical protein
VAREIRGAKLVVLDGIGHDLPPVAWPTIAEQTRQLVATSVGSHRDQPVRDPGP